MWQAIEWTPEVIKQLATVSATAIASGAISSARYVFYLAGQRRRQSLPSRCLSVASVALAGVVIGSALAALFYSHAAPLRSFGLATVTSALVDVTNWASTKAYLSAVLRAFASLPVSPQAGELDPVRDSIETSELPRGQSSQLGRSDSERANSQGEG